MKKMTLKVSLLAMAIGLAQNACTEAPKDGADGKTTLIKIVDISSEKPECINGARRYTHYTDNNGNGKLDAGEETDSFESCDSEKVGEAIVRTEGEACDASMISDGQLVFPMNVGHNPVSKSRIQAVFPGAIDYTTNKIIPLVAGENLFVCEDNKAIAPDQYRLGTVGFTKAQFDIVFIVDNSDSMKHNWTAIKEQLKAYVVQLEDKQIDYKIALVGYNESANVTGAINLGDSTALESFLEEYGGSLKNGPYTKFIGQDREGKDLDTLEVNLNTENGIPAIMYARDRLSFREGAQRVFINVTNEFLVDDTDAAPTTTPTPAPEADTDTNSEEQPAAETTLKLADEAKFIPDSDTPYTPEKFCPTWKQSDGFIHTIWMGDVLTDIPGTNTGKPVRNAETGEFILQPFDSNSGRLPPTVLTSSTCGRGIRQVMQHEYEGNLPYEQPRPRQQDIPELDFTKLLVTDAILESSMVIFQTLKPEDSHKLQIFVKGADGKFSKGEFSGNYPVFNAEK